MITCRRGNDHLSNHNDTDQIINDDVNYQFCRWQTENEDRQTSTYTRQSENEDRQIVFENGIFTMITCQMIMKIFDSAMKIFELVMTTCQITIITCQIFLITCQKIMLTCQKIIGAVRPIISMSRPGIAITLLFYDDYFVLKKWDSTLNISM